MESKLIFLICGFSMILGAYSVLLYDKYKEQDTGCEVSFRHSDRVVIMIGERK